MFLKYIDFIFTPFRAVQNKWLEAKNVKGNIRMEQNRVKSFQQRSKAAMRDAKQHAGTWNQQMNQGQQGAQMQQPGQPPGMPGMPGMPGAPGMPPGQGPGAGPGMMGGPPVPSANPPIVKRGFWVFAKKFCSQCEQQLDKTWDQCPYCQQIAAQVVAAPAKQAMKTQAFVMDANGAPGSVQMLGWIIPLQGSQKGELFTLAPVTSIGTDPKSTIVMNDKFMSSRHAEIKAENGVWVLRDSGSTNGTYVNNHRVDRHELIDNDFIKFGSALLKFKSL